jgi:hypothetical protein
MVAAPADPGHAYDFVSRVFAPNVGIDEDPVTGSAHTVLAPYWTDRLGRTSLVGLQASARSGLVGVEVTGDRVIVIGRAVTVLDGVLTAAASPARAGRRTGRRGMSKQLTSDRTARGGAVSRHRRTATARDCNGTFPCPHCHSPGRTIPGHERPSALGEHGRGIRASVSPQAEPPTGHQAVATEAQALRAGEVSRKAAR